MNENSNSASRYDMLEGRFALRVAAGLSEAAEKLPHDISERLRFARELAAGRAHVSLRAAATSGGGLVHLGATAALGGPPSLWLRLMSVLPLIVLVGGLVLIQQHWDNELIAAAADVDAALLADELPPAAYRDPGFTAYLLAQASH